MAAGFGQKNAVREGEEHEVSRGRLRARALGSEHRLERRDGERHAGERRALQERSAAESR
jgi:hypothetical protein